MTQCALCGQEASEGQEMTVWTGQTVGSKVKMGKMETHYGNFQAHKYLICPICQAGRERRGQRIVLAHIVLVVILTLLLLLLLKNLTFALVMAVMIAIVPALISLLVYLSGRPANKLKIKATRDRSQTERTRKEAFRAFSQHEYNKLQRDW